MDTITPDVSPTETQIPVEQPTPEATAPEAAAPEHEAEAAPQEDEGQKALKRMERRIARTTAARYEAEARAKQVAEEAEALRQRLAQYEQPNEQQQQVRPEDVLSLAERIAEAKTEQQRVVSTIKSVLAQGKELEGFDAACNAVNEELPFYDQRGAPTPFLKVVMETEAPARVLHYLGTNPDVAADLAGLSITQVARKLARIEADLDKPAAPAVSKAPKPITPVRGASRDDGGLSPNLPMDEWARRFRREMSKRY